MPGEVKRMNRIIEKHPQGNCSYLTNTEKILAERFDIYQI
jgi:hypothetical protein